MSKKQKTDPILARIITGSVVAILLFALFALLPCYGVYWLIKAIRIMSEAICTHDFSLWILGNGFVFLCLSIGCFVIQRQLLRNLFTKYSFCPNGVKATLWKKFTQIIPWEDFQEVCICHADFNSRSDGKLTKVICFVRKGEKKNIYGRWKVDNFLRYGKVIRLDYSSELHEELSRLCPHEIKNYVDPK